MTASQEQIAGLVEEKLFPILRAWNADRQIKELRDQFCGVMIIGIPWGMIEPHEAQAQSNHGQSLKHLASRGGLSVEEALAVLEDRPWRKLPAAFGNKRLLELMISYEGAALQLPSHEARHNG